MNTARIFRVDDDTAAATLGGGFAKAMEFVRRPDLQELPPGRYEIDGDRVFATVSENDLRLAGETQRVEFHKRYADLHVPLTGEELFGLPDLPPAVADGPFDDVRDIAFFEAACPLRAVAPGECLVVGPLVAHAPCLSREPGGRLKKVIVKIDCAGGR
ncbi:MAG: YhcH/YjgK/YiaL family protein [Kiritimatiellae bacterium]|nr:YhcH/YjgK/YiaL family protein [Kiritimatiellia bacterium]